VNEIIVRRDGVMWGAFFENRRITAAACQPCIIQVLRTVFGKSEKYTTIKVLNDDGSTQMVIPIGVTHGRTASKDL
jgi:hypothetical protein